MVKYICRHTFLKALRGPMLHFIESGLLYAMVYIYILKSILPMSEQVSFYLIANKLNSKLNSVRITISNYCTFETYKYDTGLV